MLNRNKILMMAVMGVIANLPSANAQTFYQCMPKKCGANEVMSNGNCYSTSNSGNWTLLYDYSSGEGSASLSAGTYIVSLHGGNGGSYKGTSGALGGNVFFQFTVDKSWTFKYGVGQNGENASIYALGGGGGGGSWISIDGQYIVAGGGGGAGSGGAGGAVGAGSASDYEYKYNDASIQSCAKGGKSGNYSNNNHIDIYNGDIGPEGSEQETYLSCMAGYGINKYNGGHCRIYKVHNIELSTSPGTAGGILIYPGAMTTEVGGWPGEAGLSTHNYNTNANVGACSISSGCVKLYKFKY